MTEFPGTGISPQIRAAVLQALDYIMQVELTEARWERVAEILVIANDAAVAGDLDGLLEAVEELRLVGPVRVIRVGGTPAVPPPRPVRERESDLRHTVAGKATPADQDKKGKGGK